MATATNVSDTERLKQFIWDLKKIKQRPLWLKLLLPLLLTAIASYFTFNLFESIGRRIPFMLYFGTVMISAWYGGCRSSLYATLWTTAAALIFVHPFNLMVITVYVLEALFITMLIFIIELNQAKISESEEKFRAIIEQDSEGFFMVDRDANVILAGPLHEDILGYSNEEFKGSNVFNLVHPEEAAKFKYDFLKLLLRGAGYSIFVQRLLSKAGRWIWVEACVTNLLYDPRIKALIFHYRNISERVEQDKTQEDFVHMASHELKTPITSLKGFLQLVKSRHRKEGRSMDLHLIERMESQLDKLLGLIEDMLNMTRIRAGELYYHFEWFDLVACVQEVTEALQATIDTHRLNVIASGTLSVHADRGRISQVITNLITNAVKYSPAADSVEIILEQQQDFARLEVQDRGIGIPESKQKKIFERFYRVEGEARNNFRGLGLGLYISQEIIRRHGGRMGVSSQEGEGSAFWVTLPLKTTKVGRRTF
ncbi:MAG: Two-component system, chemotaxis family, CheB/CheR fusion protein [Mucilaginibacter sp.]|nr:Two-component system, chemotaxis family, CheB/CheR fusion protein [Mucilaginibacter sp.]